ncbi:MAG: CRISPR-associated endonuclease Cas3'' [Methylococcaceae bacterium]|nr:CRISPR-associated endonuclease Cas3'' [Methylococcaceae bacterium]MDZ4155599.1 CRISPR-associated endonuclease Cas3'' [Methylococcales bacterium]MDP2395322.1 CRISPR-associated endonuclease Cas3'' [Methylococcaceae bacterium]MDP3020566.1 CRISPR-associated endonuclease Cas3'' [Methylococcaceae bacterium]MDP3390005.1 CRISPR-associated endonuclease Cas3'' [Methylococcaceae bacterium]
MSKNQSKESYIAHVRTVDKKQQTVAVHLQEVAEIAKTLAAKINVPEAGELIGLLHDFGKYSASFQNYIQSGTGLLNDMDADYVDAVSQKGKIDHSTAGAQLIWEMLAKYGKNGEGRLCGQILALCIASHHSGLIDCLTPDGTNGFKKRIDKEDDRSHLAECKQNADVHIKEKAQHLADKQLVSAMRGELKVLIDGIQHEQIKSFYIGFWTRFLFSCLIDADRINSADFERPNNAFYRNKAVSWDVAINRLELFLTDQSKTNNDIQINSIRRAISDTCKNRAQDAQGIYTLTVPTGGGKTYASLRYALHHANTHGLERIIYVIPYTSIIEQNAEAIRKVVEQDGDQYPWVLEHHSNLEPENQTWHSKLAAENWDAPIVLTTMVQFLETLFSGGTRGVRRLHQLANSVIIFDEIQTLPINCTHLFCNALNFLSAHTKTTAVLCTATQPLLDQLKSPEKGQLLIPEKNHLIEDVRQLFDQLKRVEISNKTKSEGWSEEEIAELALSEFKVKGNCLVIVNTKAWAQALNVKCSDSVDRDSLFHLSTNQCSAHRNELFHRMRARLAAKLPVLCFSTQLIEAGVDIDFTSVIRFLAGLDSIAQAAGRCNRNGRLDTATVHVVNPAKETIDQLIDIKVGRDKTKRVFSEVNDKALLDPENMALYFKYYFYERADQMAYPLTAKEVGRDDTLLNLLSDNKFNTGVNAPLHLKQSFMTAGNAFKAIDAPTQAVIVPYQQGKHLITELCGIAKEFDAASYYTCLKRAQKYSVNVFPNVWKKLLEQRAVYEIQPGEGVYCLDERYYSEAFGLSTEPVGKAEATIL